FFSNRHALHIHPVSPLLAVATSPHSSLRAVTLNTSSPRIHSLTSPQHLGLLHLRCASTGLVNQTRFLKRKVLSVRAPTGHTSITLPIKSLVKALLIQVLIRAWSPRSRIPCSRLSVSWLAANTQRKHIIQRFICSCM